MKRIYLENLRKEKGVTQEEIAKNVGINRSYYGLIENGNRSPSLNIAIKIAKYFDKPIDIIFKNETFFNGKCYSLQNDNERKST